MRHIVKTMNIMAVAILITVTIACASQTAPKKEPVKDAGTGNSTLADGGTVTGCGGTKYTVPKGDARIDGKGLQVITSLSTEARQSLCDQLLKSGKKVMVFQLASITCVTCLDATKELDRNIKSSSYSSSIGHTIVFVDQVSDYKNDQGRPKTAFIDRSVPGLPYVFDINTTLWKKFTQAGASSQQYSVIIMNKASSGKSLRENGELDQVVPYAETLVDQLSASSSAATTGSTAPTKAKEPSSAN